MTVVVQANNYHAARGGSDVVFRRTVELLRAAGVRTVAVATGSPVPAHPDDVQLEAAATRPTSLRGGLRMFWNAAARDALRAIVARDQPALAHLHIYYGQLTPAILGPLRAAGVPIVQTLHDFKAVCAASGLSRNGHRCDRCAGGRHWRALAVRCKEGSLTRTAGLVAETLLSQAAGSHAAIDRFIAVSEYQRAELVRMGLDAARIRVIPNPVELPNAVTPPPDGGPVLFVGRLVREKGVDCLLEVASLLPHRRFEIAGTGPEEARLRARCQQAGIGNVAWLGRVPPGNLDTLYQRAALVFAPTLAQETFGLVVLEAFAHGRCVVASRIGALPELVAEGHDGSLVPPGDATAAAATIESWLDDPGRLMASSQAARSKAARIGATATYHDRLRTLYAEFGARI